MLSDDFLWVGGGGVEGGWAVVGKSRKSTEGALVLGKGRRDGEMEVEGEWRVDPAGV